MYKVGRRGALRDTRAANASRRKDDRLPVCVNEIRLVECITELTVSGGKR
jgi:hypothetical protein